MAYIGLDYGHGSDTFPPSKGVYKDGKAYHEHDFNVKLGLKLKALLEAAGHRVYEGQPPNGKDVNLNRRIREYNRRKVDLVWSIHANANNDKSADGRCSFYWHTSEASKSLAYMYAEEVRKGGYNTHGDGTHASMRGSWTNLAICRDTNMPALLTENGFMTNDLPGTDDDFELIFGSKQEAYTDDMTLIHFNVIQRYFGEDTKTPTHVAPKPAENVAYHSVETKEIYRVRRSWANFKSQVGAFSVLSNAKALADKTAGYSVYDGNGKRVYSGTNNAKPTPKPKPAENLLVDGKWGKSTTRALQRALGTPVDGIISRQPSNSVTRTLYGGTVSFGEGNGSLVIRALQRKVGARVDGKLGQETVRRLQRYLGTTQDGVLSRPSLVVKEMQRRLNAGTF